MKLTLQAYCVYRGTEIIVKGLTISTDVATPHKVAQFKGVDCMARMETFIKMKGLKAEEGIDTAKFDSDNKNDSEYVEFEEVTNG